MAEQRHLHFQKAASELGSTSGRTGRSPYYRGAAGETWQGDTITRKALSHGPTLPSRLKPTRAPYSSLACEAPTADVSVL